MPQLLQPCATDPRLLSVCPDPRLLQSCADEGPIVAQYGISVNQFAFLQITWTGNCGGFAEAKGAPIGGSGFPLDYKVTPFAPPLYGIDQFGCSGGPSSIQQCDDDQVPFNLCGQTNRCYRNRPGAGGALSHVGCLRVSALRNAAGAIYGFELYGGLYVMLEKYVYISDFPQDLWSDDRQATQRLDSCCWDICNEGPTLSPVLYRDMFGVQAYEAQYTFLPTDRLCEHNELFEQIGFIDVSLRIIPPPGEAPQSGYSSVFAALANQHPEWWSARVSLQWGGARGRATGYMSNGGSVQAIIICGGGGSLPSYTFESGHAEQVFVGENLYADGQEGDQAGVFFFPTEQYQRSRMIDIVPLEDPDCDGNICAGGSFNYCSAKLYYRSNGPARESATEIIGSRIGVELAVTL